MHQVQAKVQGEDVMAYAINIADLTGALQMPEHMALAMVLRQHLDDDVSRVVECEQGKIAGVGALFTCPDEQAAALIQLVRARLKRYELRIYHSRTGKGEWKRV